MQTFGRTSRPTAGLCFLFDFIALVPRANHHIKLAHERISGLYVQTRYIYIQVNWSPYNSPEPGTLYPHGCLAFRIQTSYVPQTSQAMRSQQVKFL